MRKRGIQRVEGLLWDTKTLSEYQGLEHARKEKGETAKIARDK